MAARSISKERGSKDYSYHGERESMLTEPLKPYIDNATMLLCIFSAVFSISNCFPCMEEFVNVGSKALRRREMTIHGLLAPRQSCGKTKKKHSDMI